jgi:hypothetical protein
MRGAIIHSPNTPLWRCAQFQNKKITGTTLPLPVQNYIVKFWLSPRNLNRVTPTANPPPPPPIFKIYEFHGVWVTGGMNARLIFTFNIYMLEDPLLDGACRNGWKLIKAQVNTGTDTAMDFIKNSLDHPLNPLPLHSKHGLVFVANSL